MNYTTECNVISKGRSYCADKTSIKTRSLRDITTPVYVRSVCKTHMPVSILYIYIPWLSINYINWEKPSLYCAYHCWTSTSVMPVIHAELWHSCRSSSTIDYVTGLDHRRGTNRVGFLTASLGSSLWKISALSRSEFAVFRALVAFHFAICIFQVEKPRWVTQYTLLIMTQLKGFPA